MEYFVSYFNNKIDFSNPRWWVFSRIMAAIFAGYALATASILFIDQLLTPVSGKYQALHSGLMLSFLVYACAVMWVFSVTTATRAWLGLIKLNVMLIVLTWVLVQIGQYR
jgi:hypothetical protein